MKVTNGKDVARLLVDEYLNCHPTGHKKFMESMEKEQQEIKAAHKETSKRKVSVTVIVIIVVIIIGAAVFGYIRLQQSRRKHSRRRR
mgnify:CR=1 FL=1